MLGPGELLRDWLDVDHRGQKGEVSQSVKFSLCKILLGDLMVAHH